jgi:Family of unknown function (DUF6262)
MRADNTHHLVAAAQRRAVETRERAVAALRRLERTGQPVSFEVVAREAGVSRSWLYGQQDLREAIQQLRATCGGASTPASPPVPARQRASEASLRRRLEAVNAEIRRLRQEPAAPRAACLGTRGPPSSRHPRAARLGQRPQARQAVDHRAVLLTTTTIALMAAASRYAAQPWTTSGQTTSSRCAPA